MTTTRVGQVRPSQLLHTYGPGSLVDLPHLSVLISGIDGWSADPLAAPEVAEKRLLAAVRSVLGPQLGSLRLPPHLAETPNPFDDWSRTGVPVTVFPRWLRCPSCDRIAPSDSGLFEPRFYAFRPDLARYSHVNCNRARGKPAPAVPVGFVLACRNGHLDEFPWVGFAHRGTACPAPILEVFQSRTKADDVFVTCKACGLPARNMMEAFGESAAKTLPKCRGRHPHLRTFEDQPCDQRARALRLGASNTWFSVTKRVLAIPTAATPLGALIDDVWPSLADVGSPEVLRFALKTIPALAVLGGHDPEEVWADVEARRSSGGADPEEEEDLLGPEWAQFADPAKAVVGPDFQLREVDPPPTFSSAVERVVLGERLREVVALVGFTRIDPPGDPDLSGQRAAVGPLSRDKPEWVPCTEVRGEGFFIQFREEAMAAWEARVGNAARLAALHEAHQRWLARRGLDASVGWLGPRYLALHTLSHLLMRELALECGYGSASISERLYAGTGPSPMAGILLYTAAPDSEGTLGGLVSLGEPATLDRLLRQALDHAQLCTSDPMCSEHLPSPDEDTLHGAACHACLFAPETSCERSNRYLDRALAVDTFAQAGLGLFSSG